MKNKYYPVTVIILLVLIVAVIFYNYYDNKDSSSRIDQLENINDILRKRLNSATTATTDSDVTTTTSKLFDQEVLEFVVDYSRAQDVYITLLQGILRNNKINYPEFIYEKILEEKLTK